MLRGEFWNAIEVGPIATYWIVERLAKKLGLEESEPQERLWLSCGSNQTSAL